MMPVLIRAEGANPAMLDPAKVREIQITVNMVALDIAKQNRRPVASMRPFTQTDNSRVESEKWRMTARWTNPRWGWGRVEFAFASVELRSICQNRRRATTVIGPAAARELTERLADLIAFATVAEIADLFPDDIIDLSPTERALRLHAGHDLVFCAGHVQVPTKEDGGTDWTKVSRIRIVALEARNG